MEVFLSIIGIIVVLVLLSCSGWILRFVGLIAEFSFGCLLKGLIYFFFAIFVLGIFMALVGSI